MRLFERRARAREEDRAGPAAKEREIRASERGREGQDSCIHPSPSQSQRSSVCPPSSRRRYTHHKKEEDDCMRSGTKEEERRVRAQQQSFRPTTTSTHDSPPPTAERCSPFRSLCEMSYKNMVMKVVVVTPSSPPCFPCLPWCCPPRPNSVPLPLPSLLCHSSAGLSSKCAPTKEKRRRERPTGSLRLVWAKSLQIMPRSAVEDSGRGSRR